MKTSELKDKPLDWAVAKCEGRSWPDNADKFLGEQYYKPSTDWSQGGLIIEWEKIELRCWDFHSNPWRAEIAGSDSELAEYGPTPLIAAMRAYVASKLGDEVEIPEELL